MKSTTIYLLPRGVNNDYDSNEEKGGDRDDINYYNNNDGPKQPPLTVKISIQL